MALFFKDIKEINKMSQLAKYKVAVTVKKHKFKEKLTEMAISGSRSMTLKIT